MKSSKIWLKLNQVEKKQMNKINTRIWRDFVIHEVSIEKRAQSCISFLLNLPPRLSHENYFTEQYE